MIYLILFIAVLGLTGAANIALRAFKASATERTRIREFNLREKHLSQFSTTSQKIIEEWENLPEENRPGYDIEAVLSALDTKYGKALVDGHYVRRCGYDRGFTHTWNCLCIQKQRRSNEKVVDKCFKFPEYRDLYDSIRGILHSLAQREQAIKDHEHRMVLAGLESDLRGADCIIEALKSESEAINSITKEITR